MFQAESSRSWILWVVILALGIGILVFFLTQRSVAAERQQAEAEMHRAVLIQERQRLEQERQQIEAERRELEQLRKRIRETSDR